MIPLQRLAAATGLTRFVLPNARRAPFRVARLPKSSQTTAANTAAGEAPATAKAQPTDARPAASASGDIDVTEDILKNNGTVKITKVMAWLLIAKIAVLAIFMNTVEPQVPPKIQRAKEAIQQRSFRAARAFPGTSTSSD